jgi:transglutaminase-like putative cysteine protease
MVNGRALQEPSEEAPLIGRVIHRLRPREGWLVLALAWIGVISLPSAVAEGGLLAGVGVTLTLSTLGLLFGWWLGRRSWRGFLAAPVAFLTGVVAMLTWGVYVLNPLPSLWQIARWLAWGGTCGIWTKCKLAAPPLNALGEQATRLADFAQRVVWWVDGVIAARGIPDNLVMVGFAALIAWCVAAWAGWWIVRRGRAFLALFPTGFLLPQQIYNADAGQMWLLSFLGALTGLLVIGRFNRMTRSWDEEGVDYSNELQLDYAFTALGLAALVLVLSPLLPSLSPRSISEAFWRTFEEPYRQVEERMAQSFPGVESRRSLVPPMGVAAGGLPRAHLLGGRPELTQEIAMRVQVRGAKPGEPLYWRGQTFAQYTGRGWGEDVAASTRFPKPLDLAPGQPWSSFMPPLRRNILASVQVDQATRAVMYAAGEPISADRPYQATLRAPDELIAISAPGGPERYAVLGAVPDVSPAALRSANALYTADIIETYLRLPGDLPPELGAYATEITAGAKTPYDKAVAIEETLRKLPYTLDVPPPPKDREVVSWFLNDLGKGYCDYFASAMVVLARLSGVPARLAIGYASGSYDQKTDQYTVTEMDAHSWAEVYFPGFGWIPFEPTPSRSTPDRTSLASGPYSATPPELEFADLDSSLATLRQLGQAQAAAEERGAWIRRLLGLLCLVLALGETVALRWLVGERQTRGITDVYRRLARWGGRLGRPVRAADTPREYAFAVAAAADRIADRARRGRMRIAQADAQVQADILPLAEGYEAALYAPQAAPALLQDEESRRWGPLWSALRRLWLAKWWR